MSSQGMRVLLATDGSEEALAATDWLLTFPLPRSSTVRVFAVASLAGTLTPELESAREYRRRLSERTSLIVSAARDMLDRVGWAPRGRWRMVTRAKRSSGWPATGPRILSCSVRGSQALPRPDCPRASMTRGE
jgi:hypothetical protein